MNEEVRQKHKRVFVNNPNYHIIIGTIGALGTAHTLTVATNVIFYDEPWTEVDKSQAEERIYGLNTTQPVNIYTLLSKDTVDDKVHKIVYDKGIVSKYIVDDKLDIRLNPELFDMLLGNDYSNE
jgi:SNF2 family DNA or RNA helicase